MYWNGECIFIYSFKTVYAFSGFLLTVQCCVQYYFPSMQYSMSQLGLTVLLEHVIAIEVFLK